MSLDTMGCLTLLIEGSSLHTLLFAQCAFFVWLSLTIGTSILLPFFSNNTLSDNLCYNIHYSLLKKITDIALLRARTHKKQVQLFAFTHKGNVNV